MIIVCLSALMEIISMLVHSLCAIFNKNMLNFAAVCLQFEAFCLLMFSCLKLHIFNIYDVI